MAPNDDLITRLMLKYARREQLTDEEMRILEEWWEQFPEHRQTAEQFSDEDWVRAELAKMKPAPMGEIWERINKYLDEIGAPDDRSDPTEWESPAPPVIPRRRWVKYASAAAVLACIGATWLLIPKNGSKTTDRTSTAAVTPVPGDNEVLLMDGDGSAKRLAIDRLALIKGQSILVGKKHSPFAVRLPDGSNVWLDGGSRFEYPDNYYLQGHAFFDVAKDKSRPFIVTTPNDRTIEVLGTSFTVDAGDAESRVILLNGAVRVTNGSDHKLLRPGQEATLSPGKTDVRTTADSAAAIDWVKQSLYFHFRNTDFLAAIGSVASWYGYTISNPKGLRGTTVTDDLRKSPSPEGVVSDIGQIESGYLYVWVSNKVIHISDKSTAIDH